MLSEETLSARGPAGTPIDLPISAGPATGYSWHLRLPAAVTRLPDALAPEPAPGQHSGSAARAALRVSAPAGEYEIHAELARPWERDKPLRRVVIRLHVE